MDLPEHVQVGPYRYTIVCDDTEHARAVRDHGYDVYGATSHRQQRIVLTPDCAPDVQTVTLAHELMHAIMFASGADTVLAGYDDGLEERLIQQTSPVLVQVLRDNPTLAAWLAA